MKVKSVLLLLGRSKFSNLLFCDWILPMGRKLVVVKCSFGENFVHALCGFASERASERCVYIHVLSTKDDDIRGVESVAD